MVHVILSYPPWDVYIIGSNKWKCSNYKNKYILNSDMNRTMSEDSRCMYLTNGF